MTVSLPVAPIVTPVRVIVDYNTTAAFTPVVTGTLVQEGEACLVDGEECHKTFVVAGKGTFTVLDDGSVRFVPLDTFAGETVCATYRAYDLWYQTNYGQVCVTVSLPVAPTVEPGQGSTDYNTATSVTPVVDGTDLQTLASCLVYGSACVKVLPLAGKGTFEVLDNGDVVFAPVDTFAGETAVATYRIVDAWGQFGENTISVTVGLPAVPVVSPVVNPTDYNTSVALTPYVDATLGQVGLACLVAETTCLKSVYAAGKGTFVVLSDGSVIFTPISTFADASATITYRAYDLWGQYGESTLEVSVALPSEPVVSSVRKVVDYNTVETSVPSVVGALIQPGNACLVSGNECVSELSVANAGTFNVLDDGRVVFTPLETFAGATVTATYRAYDLWGQFDENTISIEVLLPAKPVVTASSKIVDYNQDAEFAPFVTGTLVQDGDACLVDGDACVTELVVEGKGTFFVLEDGSVTFTPLETFAGDIAWVTYRATDLWGQTGENVVSVTVLKAAAPIVEPTNVTTDYNTSKTFTPVVTGTLVQNGQACLVDGSDCVTELLVEGKGTFVILEDGSVVFTPVNTFAGGVVNWMVLFLVFMHFLEL